MAAIFFKLLPQLQPERNCTSSFPFFFNAHSFLNFPKEMTRKGPSELRLLGSFSGCSQALSPCSLLLSQMLKACQPLISSLSICRKGWLPLPCSRTLVTPLIPPAARACQRRWEENRAPGLNFQPALALHAKPPGAAPRCP